MRSADFFGTPFFINWLYVTTIILMTFGWLFLNFNYVTVSFPNLP